MEVYQDSKHFVMNGNVSRICPSAKKKKPSFYIALYPRELKALYMGSQANSNTYIQDETCCQYEALVQICFGHRQRCLRPGTRFTPEYVKKCE